MLGLLEVLDAGHPRDQVSQSRAAAPLALGLGKVSQMRGRLGLRFDLVSLICENRQQALRFWQPCCACVQLWHV